jgi:hypothetical protein
MKDVMKHIKLLNKPDERPLPTKACTIDDCNVVDDSSCPQIDTCWWDYAAGCSERDQCFIDR